uniref:Uncharacterized protein n=1 Tax=Physcomitrium patens TaxID=3218 RepID=A0A7I3YZX1_PHYPA
MHHCQFFISIGNIHLKEKLFSISFNSVNVENVNNWLWFLNKLKTKILAPHLLN